MDKWYFPIKTVMQNGRDGCAIAAVATITGVSFQDAKRAAFPKSWPSRMGPRTALDEDRILRAFARLGWMTRTVNDFRRVRTPSLVFVSLLPGTLHTIIWDPFEAVFKDPGAGWWHKPELVQCWRRDNFRSVTVLGRLPGAGPPPEVSWQEKTSGSWDRGTCDCDECYRKKEVQRRNGTTSHATHDQYVF